MFSAFLSCLSNLLLQGHKDVPVVFLGNLHCFYFPRAIYPELTLVGDCGKDPDPFSSHGYLLTQPIYWKTATTPPLPGCVSFVFNQGGPDVLVCF